MNAIRWVFFDIGSTMVDEEEAASSIMKNFTVRNICTIFM